MTHKEAEKQYALTEIALVKSYAYIQEYNPTSGQTEDKHGARYLKEGFVDGFLAGVAFRMGGGNDF
jgi:uncharacterized protein (DUF1330 family)